MPLTAVSSSPTPIETRPISRQKEVSVARVQDAAKHGDSYDGPALTEEEQSSAYWQERVRKFSALIVGLEAKHGVNDTLLAAKKKLEEIRVLGAGDKLDTMGILKLRSLRDEVRELVMTHAAGVQRQDRLGRESLERIGVVGETASRIGIAVALTYVTGGAALAVGGAGLTASGATAAAVTGLTCGAAVGGLTESATQLHVYGEVRDLSKVAKESVVMAAETALSGFVVAKSSRMLANAAGVAQPILGNGVAGGLSGAVMGVFDSVKQDLFGDLGGRARMHFEAGEYGLVAQDGTEIFANAVGQGILGAAFGATLDVAGAKILSYMQGGLGVFTKSAALEAKDALTESVYVLWYPKYGLKLFKNLSQQPLIRTLQRSVNGIFRFATANLGGVGHVELGVNGVAHNLVHGFAVERRRNMVELMARAANGGHTLKKIEIKVSRQELQDLSTILEQNAGKSVVQNCSSGLSELFEKATAFRVPFPFGQLPASTAVYLSFLGRMGSSRVGAIEWIGKHSALSVVSLGNALELTLPATTLAAGGLFLAKNWEQAEKVYDTVMSEKHDGVVIQ